MNTGVRPWPSRSPCPGPSRFRPFPCYRTPCCGTDLGERAFGHAIAVGAWRPTKAEAVPGTRGFHLDAFTSPFETLQTIARQWKRADAHRKQTGSMAETIAFQQGRLALPFKPEAGQGVTPAAIETSCREDYDPATVPAGASIVIGAVDVQDSLDTYGDNGLLLIGADSGKASVYSLLRQSIGGSEPRPMVWPLAEDSYGPEEFEQLCSETLVRHLDKRSGRTSLQWKKIGRHNEALDLAVYSLASVSWLGVGFLLAERAAIEAATERRAA